MNGYPPKKTSIKNWAEDDRPREKLLHKGKSSLSDAELIAVLIGSGNRAESAVELSRRILNHSKDNLIELSRIGVNDLIRFRGVGQAKAIAIIAALELGKRRRYSEVLEKPKITSSEDAYEHLYPHLSDLNYEHFLVMFLDQANNVIQVVNISAGGITGTVADPKKIFKLALEYNACNLILGHNHPSGQLKPSEADIKLTKQMIQAGSHLDIQVVDHLIVGNDKFFSFMDEGLM